MFDFLKSDKNSFIGIDFGTSSIKVVELLCKNQQVFLQNYGVVDFNQEENKKQFAEQKKSYYKTKVNTAIRKLLERMKVNSKSAYVSLPGFSGLITIIELPKMQDEELEKAIQFEAHKYIPSSLDEISISWEIIEHADSAEMPLTSLSDESDLGKKSKILLVAAPKKEVERYEKFVSGIKPELAAVELENFSITRALVGNDSGNFLIIDIGARATNIVLIEKGVIIVSRNIDTGGSDITSALSENMNVSRQRAEIFKKGEEDILNNRESLIVIPAMEFIVNESKRIITAYKTKNKDSRIDGVLLSGGTAKMKGIEKYFSSALGINVAVGNPWRRIIVKENASSLIKNLGGSFSVAIGLALRGLEEQKHK